MDLNNLQFPLTRQGAIHHHTPHAWSGSVSRRRFIKTAAGVTGAVLGAELYMPALTRADSPGGTPTPIPRGGLGLPLDFRIFGFGPGAEPSSITDFKGFIGVTDVQGMATNMMTGERILVDTDMRFMDGVFIGTDGKMHQGTFGFI